MNTKCAISKALASIVLSNKKTETEKEHQEVKNILNEIASLQKNYQQLVDERKLTKKAMCDLCIPFRDKYSLTDLQTLRIARNEMDVSEIASLFDGKEGIGNEQETDRSL